MVKFGNILTVISSGMTAAKMGWQHDTPDPPAQQTFVNVALGHGPDGRDPGSMAGVVDVRIFTSLGEQIARCAKDKHFPVDNQNIQIQFHHWKNHQHKKATYGLFSANNDAICIAWVKIQRDDHCEWVWSGDWAGPDGCNNAPWSYSNANLGSIDGKSYSPKCIWIDADHTHDLRQTGFQVFWPDFGVSGNESFPPDIKDICDTPSFMTFMYPDPKTVRYYHPPNEINNRKFLEPPKGNQIPNGDGELTGAQYYGRNRDESRYLEAEPHETPWKRSREPREHVRRPSKDRRLILTSKPHHNVTRLCASDTSWGPSFVSRSEGRYCDMKTKTLYNVCNSEVAVDSGLVDRQFCFDMQSKSVVKKSGIAGRVRSVNPSDFSRIIDWDNE